MAHTGIFATKAEIDVFVGENVDVTGYTETNINAACLQVEGYINGTIRKTITSTLFTAMNSGIKGVLAMAAASMVAIQFISYNMSGYTSRIEAEDMLNLAWATHRKMMKVISDQKWVTYAGLG